MKDQQQLHPEINRDIVVKHWKQRIANGWNVKPWRDDFAKRLAKTLPIWMPIGRYILTS